VAIFGNKPVAQRIFPCVAATRRVSKKIEIAEAFFGFVVAGL